MRYRETRPSPDLAAFVHCYWELEGRGDALDEPIFPDGRVELVMHLGGRPRAVGAASPQPDLMVVGQMTAAIRLEIATSLHAVGVRFTPTGAGAWLATPLHELTDAIASADDLRSGAARRLRTAIEAAGTSDERVRALEHALRGTLLPDDRAGGAVEWAVRTTIARAGRITVGALARTCGVSGRHLERQYLAEVGLTPKAFARTVRFQHALRGLRGGRPPATVASSCGFADQSHLAREFKRFAGAAARDVDLARVVFVQDGHGTAGAD